MLDAVEAIRDRIALCVIESLPEVTDIDYGRARVPPTLPYAGIHLEEAPRDFNGVRSVEEVYRFSVTAKYPVLEGQVAEDEKLRVARILGERLLDEDWNEVGGYLPLIQSVSFAEGDEPDKPTFEVAIGFVVRASVFQ